MKTPTYTISHLFLMHPFFPPLKTSENLTVRSAIEVLYFPGTNFFEILGGGYLLGGLYLLGGTWYFLEHQL